MLQLNFDPFPDLVTDRIILRKLCVEDAPEVFVLRSNSLINKFINREPAKNNKDAEEWILMVLEQEKNGNSINWAITLKGESKLIGSICLWNIERELERAEVGYSLHVDFFAKGIMNEVLEKVLSYGFEKMKLKRIDAYTHKENVASLKLLKRHKFERNLAFENDFEDKEELEYNTIHTLLSPSNF